MRHLLVCPEYPPARPGGIGRYAERISRLLAERGEVVHVIAPRWTGAEAPRATSADGRLTVHRLPWLHPGARVRRRPHRRLRDPVARALFAGDFPAQAFAWSAALLAERLAAQEAIDVIEGQDYQAPLYYLQVRRALGLGPRGGPPLLVHLHSPTEWIVRFNDWDAGAPAHAAAARLEEYSILAADGLICPSRFLAHQVAERYALDPEAIAVVPYPVGDRAPATRSAETWREGPVVYVGRLEPRKGVLEWIRAAVAVAREDRDLRCALAGANLLERGWETGREVLARLVPAEVAPQFEFLGPLPPDAVAPLLDRARIAVVPSRWDNLPHTCLEAMASGLPVITTREGGMAELVADGRTGWVAEAADPGALRVALRRALSTPPETLAAMGAAAAVAVRAACGDERTAVAHLAVRRQIVARGTHRSIAVPVTPGAARRESPPNNGTVAVVILAGERAEQVPACLQRLLGQTRAPAAVVVVGTASRVPRDRAEAEAWPLLRASADTPAAARRAALDALDGAGVGAAGVAFLAPGDDLRPRFLAVAGDVLAAQPHVGIVSCWTIRAGAPASLQPLLPPSLPFAWLRDEAAAVCVLRTTALREARARPLANDLDESYVHWDTCLSVLTGGWAAVAVPEVLAVVEDRRPVVSSRQYGRLLERHRAALQSASEAALVLAHGVCAQAAGDLPPRDRLAAARAVARQPARLGGWIIRTLVSGRSRARPELGTDEDGHQ